LSQFSRRARWLNALFPQSVAPATRDPAQRSDDVSLVQPYDGGGYGYRISAPVVRTAIQTGALGGIIIINTSQDEVYRIESMDSVMIAGARPTVFIIVIDEGSLDSVNISGSILAPGVGASQLMPDLHPTVIGPNMSVNCQWFGGDVLTQLTFGVYGFRAPLGTSFQV